MPFNARAGQSEVIQYRGGRLAVAAVPGSGKTRTLSYLAAQLVAEGDLREDQEVLVVTMSNSAADNFSKQVNLFIREDFNLMPGVGYRVRTLHGLANDILRMRPELIGLGEAFEILDDADSERLMDDAVRGWVKTSPGWYYELDENPDNAQSRSNEWMKLLKSAAIAFIKKAKDERWSPVNIAEQLKATQEPLVLARACHAIYDAYSDLLTYRGALDFADLIGGALMILQKDAELLDQLQERWPYILEDESQDSSLAQEKLLRLLTAKYGNWVRVGDPNQAIYETFTTASPEHLRRFMRETGVQVTELPHSGRSTASIIKLANELARWAREHPNPEVRGLVPLAPPDILPTPSDDPQPNPVDNPRGITLMTELMSSDNERKRIAAHIQKMLEAGGDANIAVLVPRNASGAEMAKELQALGISFHELLRTPSSARRAAKILSEIVHYLAHPIEMGRLERAFEVWYALQVEEPRLAHDHSGRLFGALKRSFSTEEVLFSDESLIGETVENAIFGDGNDAVRAFWAFRGAMGRWLRAAVLPIDQLILMMGQEIFTQPFDLAVVHALALGLRRKAENEPKWRLRQFAGELEDIAENRRSVYGLSEDIEEADGVEKNARVTISTMHRAKGLEWDRVYLTSINNYDFPSGEPHDTYLGEREFVRGGMDVVQEVVGQLQSVMNPLELDYVEGEATRQARFEYVSERLRLLYVGITRARKALVVTCNEGQGQARPAAPLIVLEAFWREHGRPAQ